MSAIIPVPSGTIPLPTPIQNQKNEANPLAKKVEKVASEATAKASAADTKKRCLLTQPKPIQEIMLSGLSLKELVALKESLGKGADLNPLRVLVEQTIPLRTILTTILKDKQWTDNIDSWKHVSLKDKVWLLRVINLRNLGIPIPPVDAVHSKSEDILKCPHIPSKASLKLLQPEFRNEINKVLASITEAGLSFRKLRGCPDELCLLTNLQVLNLSSNAVAIPPDVSQFRELKVLNLNNNQLVRPPDVKNNSKLTELHLSNNGLDTPPDVRHNGELRLLFLELNQLTASPDTSQNGKLVSLSLNDNKLTKPPDVSCNVALEYLSLSANLLTEPPDISLNGKLETLNLDSNEKLQKLPTTGNPKCNVLFRATSLMGAIHIIPKVPPMKISLEALSKILKKDDDDIFG